MEAAVTLTRSLQWERVKASFGWRARQLELFYAMTGRRPHKWAQFVSMLHAQGIELRFRDLWMIAPARWRGNASLFGDPRRVHQLLMRHAT
jgi:hypothetical protein